MTGTDILRTVCCHGAAKAVGHAGKEITDLAGSGNGGNGRGAEGIDTDLKNDGPDGGDGILQAHGDASDAELVNAAAHWSQIHPREMENGEAMGNPDKT